MRSQQVTRFAVRLLEQALDLNGDDVGHGRAIGLPTTRAEGLQTAPRSSITRRESHGTQSLAHAPAGDHLSRQVGRLLHVVLGPGRARLKDQLFSRSATHGANNARVQVLFAIAVAVVLGPLVGDS